VHVERRTILFAVSSNDRQEVRSVRNSARQKHYKLGVSRADHRHQVALTPDLRRLRAESDALDGERLIHAIDRGAQDDDLIRGRRDCLDLLLGVREFRPQYHDQERNHYGAG